MSETRYTKDHEYIRVEGDVGIVGITDFAQGARRIGFQQPAGL